MLLIILAILITLIILTTIQIHIENVRIELPKRERNLNKRYKITIKFCILKKFTYLKLDITKKKIERVFIQKNIDKLKEKIKKDKNKIDTKIISKIKKVNLKIQKLNLQIYLGLEDAGANAITVGILSCFMAIIIGLLYEKNVFEVDSKCNRKNKEKKENEENSENRENKQNKENSKNKKSKNNKENQINWKILPIYNNKNLLNINLDCIISFNLMHIIYTSTKGG